MIVLACFALLLAFSGYEITTMKQGIVPEDAVAEDRYDIMTMK